METIIEEQEKELLSNKTSFEVYSELGIGVNYINLVNWHKNSIKQILQALVEREEDLLFSDGCCGESADCGSIKFNKAKQDTIQYLQEQIKKL